MTRPRVLLADDHWMVAEGLKALIAEEFDLAGVVEDGHAMVAAVRSLRPDVVVADITMPQLNGIEALEEMRRSNLKVPVVFLTMHRNVAYVRRAVEAGASGFVLKDSARGELMLALRAALRGDLFITPALSRELLESAQDSSSASATRATSLTGRQREILGFVAKGRSIKEIAAKLGVSARTVEFHKYRMMKSLGVESNAELIRFAIENHVLEP